MWICVYILFHVRLYFLFDYYMVLITLDYMYSPNYDKINWTGNLTKPASTYTRLASLCNDVSDSMPEDEIEQP